MVTFQAIGRVSQDPVTRYDQSGSPVYNFNIAINRRFVRENGKKADFWRCVAFGKTAERMAKLQIAKGTKLYIQGEIQKEDYTDKNGVTKEQTQIIIADFDFCESKNTNTQAAAPVPTTATARPDTNTRPTRAQDMAPTDFMALNDGLDAELPFY